MAAVIKLKDGTYFVNPGKSSERLHEARIFETDEKAQHMIDTLFYLHTPKDKARVVSVRLEEMPDKEER